MLTNLIKLHLELLKAGIPVFGVSADGRIDFEDTATSTQRLLAQSIVDSFNPNAPSDVDIEKTLAEASKTEFESIPQWATWTPQQASDFINGQIFNGQTKEQIDAWVDANVTTLATAKTGLKNLATEIIAIRGDMAKMAQLLMLLRNLAVRDYD